MLKMCTFVFFATVNLTVKTKVKIFIHVCNRRFSRDTEEVNINVMCCLISVSQKTDTCEKIRKTQKPCSECH